MTCPKLIFFLCISVKKIFLNEFDADTGFISQCQECIETRANTSIFGKLGSGKRTLAAQIDAVIRQ